METEQDTTLTDYQVKALEHLIGKGLATQDGCTLIGKQTDDTVASVRRLTAIGFVAIEADETVRRQHVILTDIGRAYVDTHFEFGPAAQDAPKDTEQEKKPRGPKGMKLAGVMNCFAPLPKQNLTKYYRGTALNVEVDEDGSCHVNGTYYTSLSKAASSITGQVRINGRKFFGVKTAAKETPNA